MAAPGWSISSIALRIRSRGKQMKKITQHSGILACCIALLSSALLAGCGRDAVLGTGGIAVLAPTVTAVAPLNNAVGVPVSNTIITAAFSEPMAAITGSASFTVSCAAPCTNPAGTVALDGSNQLATYTLATGTSLEPLTLY